MTAESASRAGMRREPDAGLGYVRSGGSLRAGAILRTYIRYPVLRLAAVSGARRICARAMNCRLCPFALRLRVVFDFGSFRVRGSRRADGGSARCGWPPPSGLHQPGAVHTPQTEAVRAAILRPRHPHLAGDLQPPCQPRSSRRAACANAATAARSGSRLSGNCRHADGYPVPYQNSGSQPAGGTRGPGAAAGKAGRCGAPPGRQRRRTQGTCHQGKRDKVGEATRRAA